MSTSSSDDRRSRRIAGGAALAMGIFMIVLSLGVFELHGVSRRGALFNDPRNWQLTAFGLVFALAGVSLWIPAGMQMLGRFNAMALVLAMIAGLAGSVWYGSGGARLQKGGSMAAFLDSIANWFQSVGMHPVLGAFIAGVVIAFVFAYRRNPETTNLDPMAVPLEPVFRQRVAATTQVAAATLAVNGRTVEFSSEVMAHIRAGNKIDAIKALRSTSGMDLKAAKDAVEAMAASPAMH